MEQERTNEEVEAAYVVARKVAARFMRKVRATRFAPSLEFEDYVQEGVMAWLRDKPMFWAMFDAMRKNLPLSSYYATVKSLPEVSMFEYHELIHSDIEGWKPEIDDKLDAEKIFHRIRKIEDEKTQFAVMAYTYFGLSLREIAEILGLSHETVRVRLIEPELKKIKEEFNAC